MRTFFLLNLFFVLALFQGCNHKSGSEYNKGELLQSGMASWYGPGFHGRITSSRERFDQHERTAAHRTLPFDTIVKVVNLENDQSVEVRINDRGPYENNRIIDLSRAAAEEIGMLANGVAEVELILVEAGGSLPDDLDQPIYTIQIGEYNRLPPAELFAESVGDGVRIEQRFPKGSNQVVYMIYYGNYNSIGNANEQLNKLEAEGIDGLVKQIN